MIVCRKEQVHSSSQCSGDPSIPFTGHSYVPEATTVLLCPESALHSWHNCFPLSTFRGNVTSAKTPLPYRRVPLTPAPHPDGFAFTRPFPLPQPFVYFIALITVHNHITYFLLSCFQAVPLHMHTCL